MAGLQSNNVYHNVHVCGFVSFAIFRVLVVVAKRFDNVRYNVKMEQKLGISRHITLDTHCESQVPLAHPPQHAVYVYVHLHV